MKRASHRHQLRLITEMSVTPLLDLVFVLLFVFMVAAPLLQPEREIDVPMAKSEPVPKNGVESAEPAEVVKLEMSRDLTLSLDGVALARVDLERALTALAEEEPGVGVVLRMDKTLAVEHLVDLMGALEGAGIQRTAVAATTEPALLD